MKLHFRIVSIVYRVVLVLPIPLLLLGNFLTAAAGHNRALKRTDYLLFSYCVVAVSVLTLYSKRENKDNKTSRVLFLTSIGVVSISILFVLYELYDTFFICKCFATEYKLMSLALVAFGIIAASVIAGLIQERKKISDFEASVKT